MADLTLDQKSALAATLLEQSPPGQVNDVINDIRSLIADDENLMRHVRPSLRAYNLAQLTAVEHPATEGVPAHTSLLSDASILPGSGEDNERYVDAEGRRSFAFDHITLAVSDYESYELPEEEANFRAELANSLGAYAKNHFPSGSYSVSCSQHPLFPPSPTPAAPETQAAEPAAPAPESTQAEPKEQEQTIDEPVTDVVPEEAMIGGEVEPAPTPATGVPPEEEVKETAGAEKLDEELEEVKEHEQTEQTAADAPEAAVEVPVVEEDAIQVPVAEPAESSAPVEQKLQEKVDNPTYTLEVVGNRYNTSNFWTGRWRTRWIVDQAAGTVSGTINVDVHYYEQGNVQLATEHKASFPCPVQANGSQSVASQIVTTIAKTETNYQLELTDVYDELGEKAFRALRRALPVTRQKMDWDKVGGYSLGSDISKARS